MNTKTFAWPVALAILALATAGRAQPCPTTVTLAAYPNPFARSLRIEYALPEASPVSARITNIRGVTVSRLLAGEPQTEGTHWLTFESESLLEGV